MVIGTLFVHFLDDFSRFTWFYPLKKKSDVFSTFIKFKTLIENKFGHKIKALQTDWGGEYRQLSAFCDSQGIIHRRSCPHTHEQNGKAERKHRHITEIGLTLLAHACMPLSFWDDAFATAVYLINRLPTKVLNFSSPLTTLHGKAPDYLFIFPFCSCSFFRSWSPT